MVVGGNCLNCDFCDLLICGIGNCLNRNWQDLEDWERAMNRTTTNRRADV